ncbi:MAG: efflux RND transporter periplasmic adaptor subunit, partial [Cyanobacteria bacterium P01_F01_bin.42]
LTVGQSVRIRLDAFKGQTFPGKITRISPLADASSRLIPVEIVMDNPGDRIGAGLLARVSLERNREPRITVPVTALQKNISGDSSAAGQKRSGFRAQRQEQSALNPGDKAYVFVASPGKNPVVRVRQVSIGEREDGIVEIRSGLNPEERYVTRSNRPLEDGIKVQVSALSQIDEP